MYPTRNRWAVATAVVAVAVAIGFGIHHVIDATAGPFTDLRLIVLTAYGALVFTAVMPYWHRDITPNPKHRDRLASHYVLTIVPVHNEDPAMFRAMLDSIMRQVRRPQRLHIVENGDLGSGYRPAMSPVVDAWRMDTSPDFEVRYDFSPVADKREAQAVALRDCPQATIHMTLDSDVALGDEHTIARGIAPFASRRVTSVCGMLLGSNAVLPWRRHPMQALLVRLVDLGFVSAFLCGRASYSMVASVAVNAGGLAFYRARIMNNNLDHYLGHRIFGRRMSSGDDAMWTRYALLEGYTLFQRGAWGYTLHPERRSHLARQRVRWHRSFFWGNLWLIRHYPIRRLVWWLTLWEFIAFAWFTVALPAVVVVAPARTGQFAWMFVTWFALVSYLTTAPYLTVARSDMTFRQQLGVWAMAPLAGVLNLYLGWWLRYVGLVTCLRTGWGTRQDVEVGLTP